MRCATLAHYAASKARTDNGFSEIGRYCGFCLKSFPAVASPELIQRLFAGYSAETTPKSALSIADFRDHLPGGTEVAVTFLPGSDFCDTVACAARLERDDMRPIPHFAARSFGSKAQLEDAIARVVGEANVDSVLCIAGGIREPAGPFTDSMQMLRTGLFEKYGIKRICVAGHPEGCPDIASTALEDSLLWKNAYRQQTGTELLLMTQFVFDVAPIIAWDQTLRELGNQLPVIIGIPGLATLRTLIKHAKACGIGSSLRVLTRQAPNIGRLLSVNEPNKLVADLANYQATDPQCRIAGVHLYPFGGLKKTARWANAIVAGQIERDDTNGFSVSYEFA